MENVLLNRLIELEKIKFGNTSPISNNITNYLIPVADKLLQRIPAYMPEYTLHDINHCEAILNNISKFLPANINLNLVEITILIYSVYLHDIGMVVNRNEVSTIKSTNSYREFLLEFDKEISEDQILTEYIRKTHVERSIDYIGKFKKEFATYKIDFSFNGIDFSDWVCKVILSHGLAIDKLESHVEFPVNKLIDDYKVNIQFLTTLLRLGDLLEFDIFRTPYFLYKFINPQNNISDEEWKKHLSIEGKEITDTLIRFDAKCTSAKIERAVRSFCEAIETERLEINNLLRDNLYKLDLNEPVKLHCRNDGSYIYNDLAIELSYEKVLNILMGTELYESADIFIRELIQNSYDACRYRENKSSGTDIIFKSKVTVRYISEGNFLEIEDNGIGISDDIFKNYVIKIGRSYYQSKTVQLQKLNFSPISNFGIGILSCFMVSDSIEIESLEYKGAGEHSTAIHYILNIKDKYIEQRNARKSTFGSLIRLRLKEDYVKVLKSNDVLKVIKENMNCFDIPVEVWIDDKVTLLDNSLINVPAEYSIINDIEIIETKIEELIQGYIIIHANHHSQLIKQDKISQQCFKINGRNTHIKLGPLWLQSSKFFVDIKPEGKLKLKASRNAVYEDKNFFNLKERISEVIIKHLSTIDPNRLLPYLSQGRSAIFSGNQNEYDFLVNYFPFQIITTKTRQVQVHSFKGILKNFKTNKLAVLDSRLLAKHAHSNFFWETLKDYEYILISSPFDHFFYQFLIPCSMKKKMIISNIPGLVFTSITYNRTAPLTLPKNTYTYDWSAFYPIYYLNSSTKVFCIIGYDNNNFINVIINELHPLGELLNRFKTNVYVLKFDGSFKTNITAGILQGRTLTKYVSINGQHHYMPNDNTICYSEKAINLIHSTFLSQLNASMEEQLLVPLFKEQNLLDTDFEQYYLTTSDFPVWWINKEK